MRLRPKKLALTVVGLLLLSWLTVSLWSAAAQAARAGSSLQIRIESEDGAEYPPGDLVLSDPNARMTGSDSRANNNYQEIPGATYGGETISSRQHAIRLYVDNAVSGTYSLRVIGVESGRYILSMKGYDEEGNHADLRFTGGLEPGEVHHFVIHYSNQGGASLRARRTSVTE